MVKLPGRLNGKIEARFLYSNLHIVFGKFQSFYSQIICRITNSKNVIGKSKDLQNFRTSQNIHAAFLCSGLAERVSYSKKQFWSCGICFSLSLLVVFILKVDTTFSSVFIVSSLTLYSNPRSLFWSMFIAVPIVHCLIVSAFHFGRNCSREWLIVLASLFILYSDCLMHRLWNERWRSRLQFFNHGIERRNCGVFSKNEFIFLQSITFD